jgi:hypothetical protein
MIDLIRSSKNTIRNRKKLEDEIYQLEKKLDKLKDKCHHYNLIYRFDGYRLEYDGAEEYWTDWFCKDCRKRWNTGQEFTDTEPILKKHPHAKRICKWNNKEEWENFYKVDT